MQKRGCYTRNHSKCSILFTVIAILSLIVQHSSHCRGGGDLQAFGTLRVGRCGDRNYHASCFPQAKVTFVSSTVVPGWIAYCTIGMTVREYCRLVLGMGSKISGVPRPVRSSTAQKPPGCSARAAVAVQLCAAPGQSSGMANPASNASQAISLVTVWRRRCGIIYLPHQRLSKA